MYKMAGVSVRLEEERRRLDLERQEQQKRLEVEEREKQRRQEHEMELQSVHGRSAVEFYHTL